MQSVTTASGAPGEGGHPQHGEAGQRSGEGARGGGLGVQEASPVYVWVGAVTGPLDAAYRGLYRVLGREEEAAPGSRG